MQTGGTDGDKFNLSSFKLWADYIYLDTDERRRFAQVSHEYLIEQLQFIKSSSHNLNPDENGIGAGVKTHDLDFNHPVKELIFTVPAVDSAEDDDEVFGYANYNTFEKGGTLKLVLNGNDRFEPREIEYFSYTQVWQHHSGYIVNGGIGVYSFALKPEEHQPSGTCNFSRIDNAQLISSKGLVLRIYAVNYNVLRITSGMAGLAYSN